MLDEDAVGGAVSRREAIKKATVAGAALGTVWSAPKIHGLSLRPSYAVAGSGAPPQSWSVTFAAPATSEPLFGLATVGTCSVESAIANASAGTVGASVFGSGLAGCTVNVDRYDTAGPGTGVAFTSPPSNSAGGGSAFTSRPAGGMLPFPITLKGNFVCA